MAHFSTPPSTGADNNSMAKISTLHQDIIANILARLDGPTLASACCASSQLRALFSQESLWSKLCHSTWPSTDTPRLRHIISSFPGGSRSFFSDAYPLVTDSRTNRAASNLDSTLPELISAIDLYYRGKLIFSKVVETETMTGWFQCLPFRIDLVDLKDAVAKPIPRPEMEDTCRDMEEDLTLSWIVVDPIRQRAANLSSHRAVSVQRHWLSGKVQARFASVVSGGEKGSPAEAVQCGIVVTCSDGRGASGGEIHVREVSVQVEDMGGTHLNGRDSLVVLRRVMEGKRGKSGRRAEEGKRKYEEFLERKRERKERKMRAEGVLDMLVFCWR